MDDYSASGPDGGSLVARTLREAGVGVAFGLHGGHLDSLLVGMDRCGIRLIDVRHEAVGVNAADGYARATGGLGVAFATAGAGFTNALAGLATANVDRSPVLLFTSSPPLRDAETNALQGGLDQVAAAAPMCKWAHRVTAGEEIPRLIAHAIRVATTGAPGPVVLDIPVDVLFRPVRADRVAGGGPVVVAFPPAPSAEGVRRALNLLRVAERPALVAGGGVRTGQARERLAAFASAMAIPVFHQANCLGALAHDHPCNGGSTKDMARLGARGVAPDLVVMLGARFGKNTGGRSGVVVPADAVVIQVDIDPVEIGRTRPVEVGLTADVAEALSALTDRAPTDMVDRDDWLATATAVTVQPFEDEAAEDDTGMHPYHAIRELFRAISSDDAVVVVDGGETGSWAGAAIREAKAHRVTGFGGYLGYLGTGQGLAIGAQVAEPDRPVVLLTGDGALGFNVQEFDTMVRHDLPILTAVVNNQVWGMSIHGQQEVYGKDHAVACRLADTDYDQVAQAMGASGQRITRLDEIAPAVKRWQAERGVCCLNMAVSPEIGHPSTIAAIGKTDDPSVVVVPYYDNIS